MNRCVMPTLTALVSLSLGITVAAATAMAQTANDLVGTWMNVSVSLIRADGSKADAFGSNMKGLTVFESNGHFVTAVGRTDLPKFASGNRMTGTAEENKAVVQGSLAFFGTYTVANKIVTLKVEGGTWPGWIGADEQQTIVSFTGDELKFTQLASAGGTAEVTLKRLR